VSRLSHSAVRTARDLDALASRSQTARKSALTVVARARNERITIARALTELRREGEHVSRASVLKYASGAIERGPGGRLRSTPSDRIYRRIPFLTPSGVEMVDVRSSRRATLVGQYRNALRAYLEGDDPEGTTIRRFRGKSVGGRPFETDLDAIEAWAARPDSDELNQEGS